MSHRSSAGGFTLIEMSIVLVIIGLIVGGILIGRDLISAAAVRAQVAQIGKYNSAANTFRDKFGGLPGDLPAPYANQFGFQARGLYTGEGDGNGIITGIFVDAPNSSFGASEGAGETVMFWVDLSTARLIDGGFNTASANALSGVVTLTSTPNVSAYLPQARIGQGNYLYVWSGGINGSNNAVGDGNNYFGISAAVSISAGCGGCLISTPGLSVTQAYDIDRKVDDGYPQTGRVLAQYVNLPTGGSNGIVWAGASGTAATQGTPATCYDNGNAGGATQKYSLEENNGNGINCALSVIFQ